MERKQWKEEEMARVTFKEVRGEWRRKPEGRSKVEINIEGQGGKGEKKKCCRE